MCIKKQAVRILQQHGSYRRDLAALSSPVEQDDTEFFLQRLDASAQR
jgi:hypothetical protein